MDRWPPDAKRLLERGLEDEPDKDVRSGITTLLAGKEIEEVPARAGEK
jgi:hypothetical protein